MIGGGGGAFIANPHQKAIHFDGTRRVVVLGVELVRDRDSLEPATEEASDVINQMRERGILLSTDGPFENVIKIKPPLVFSHDDAGRVIGELDVVLAGVPRRTS